jgi:CHAT domain-containing protein
MTFASLPASRDELQRVAAQFAAEFDEEATLLVRSQATKAALAEHAGKARYLHIATHGWFAPESVKSVLDEEQDPHDGRPRLSLGERLTGFAPMTAEELCALGLANCELAVLSACETNVGIRRAGQGIQSLQTALHVAGVRSAITSLWKVDDAATRRLFELFYAKLMGEDLGKADALWQAKMALRAEGHPTRDWAGWVLSGNPD